MREEKSMRERIAIADWFVFFFPIFPGGLLLIMITLYVGLNLQVDRVGYLDSS